MNTILRHNKNECLDLESLETLILAFLFEPALHIDHKINQSTKYSYLFPLLARFPNLLQCFFTQTPSHLLLTVPYCANVPYITTRFILTLIYQLKDQAHADNLERPSTILDHLD